ncbi:MAG: hypothetical protein U9P10_16335 [Thermodesulfobacteriota bacterium]|nr:hypothetical protein [Thermodesulfobacteriota bacterium]
MTTQYDTLELVRLYERQGKYERALAGYQALLKDLPNDRNLLDSIDRVKAFLQENQDEITRKKLFDLFDQWIQLLLIEKKKDALMKILLEKNRKKTG